MRKKEKKHSFIYPFVYKLNYCEGVYYGQGIILALMS